MKTEWEANADAARRREPTVGQEAVSSRSRMRRLVRSQWFTPRHGRLNAACCLSLKIAVEVNGASARQPKLAG